MAITIEVAPYITEVAVSQEVTTITANLAVVDVSATSIIVTPTGTITATDLQGALEQLADQNFRQSTTPGISNLDEGDTWYNTETEQLYVYRETSPATFEWVPVILGSSGADSDTLDAGAF